MSQLRRPVSTLLTQVIKKLAGAQWPAAKIEFDRWRSFGKTIFPEEVWAAADEYHGYQWWQSFGDDFKYLNNMAVRVLSKPIAASACEFNWSDVAHVIHKRTSTLSDSTIDKKVNVRAMHTLEKQLFRKVLIGNIPKLDDFLDTLVNEAIDECDGAGDDVADVDVLHNDNDDDYDEEYALMCDEDDVDEGECPALNANTDLNEAVGDCL